METDTERLPKELYRAVRNQYHAIQNERSEWPERSELATAVRVEVMRKIDQGE